MAAFLGCTSFAGSAVVSKPALSSRSRAPASRSATVSMAVKDFEMWKTEWAGGFPGGEGFFKKWLEEGMKEDVPGLEENLQASNPNQGSSIVPPGPTPSAASVAAAAKLGGTTVVEREVAAVQDSPVTVRVAGGAPPVKVAGGAGAVKVAGGAGAVKAAGSAPKAPSVPKEEAGPDPALYMKYYKFYPVNVAPTINVRYDRNGPRANDRLSLSMNEVSGNFADLYYPAQYKNKAPVIKIDYVPGGEFTAGVSLSMSDIEGPPAAAAPVAKGEVATSLTTDPYTGNLKLDFSVDGADVNPYSDPRSIDKYDQMYRK